MPQDSITIENPAEDRRAFPYLYVPLFDGDVGESDGRALRLEFAARAPVGVVWQDDAVSLVVGNSGFVASDLIRVDYELRICTAAMHGLTDGFNVDHAWEVGGSTFSDVTRLEYLEPRSRKPLRIALPEYAHAPNRDGLANLYFRARLSSLLTRPVAATDWNFVRDAAVTESTLRIAR